MVSDRGTIPAKYDAIPRTEIELSRVDSPMVDRFELWPLVLTKKVQEFGLPLCQQCDLEKFRKERALTRRDELFFRHEEERLTL